MHLRHWIPLQKLSFKELFLYNNHPCLLTFLENQFNSDPLTRNVVFKQINFALKNIKSDWEVIFAKDNMMALIEESLDIAQWWEISANPGAIPLLEQHPRGIRWEILSANPNAIPILENNLDKVDWYYLSMNPNVIPILEKNLEKVDWEELSGNPNAISILAQHLDKVDWLMLSCSNPNALCLFVINYLSY